MTVDTAAMKRRTRAQSVDRPRLVYGIGAPKAGSSWLYKYFEHHPQFVMPLLKELRYFNTVYADPPVRERHIARFHQKIEMLEKRLGGDRRVRRLNFIKRWSELVSKPGGDDELYVSILAETAAGGICTADITPSYCTLPAEVFKRMAETDPEAKFVFVVRDPVSRLWSDIRQVAIVRFGDSKSPDNPQKMAEERLSRFIAGQARLLMAHSDYVSTLKNLDAAVHQSRVKVLFFEDIFTDGGETINSLCDFLEVERAPAPIETKVNEGVDLKLSDDNRKAITRVLLDQYLKLREYFGKLPESWQRSLAEIGL